MVFFECRLEQLTQDLARANEEVARLKGDLGEASKRELALKAEVASAESKAAQSSRDREDALERVRLGRAEREHFLEKLIEGERIRSAGQEVEGLDLAAFISDLRSEVLNLRAQVNGGVPSAPAIVNRAPVAPPVAAAAPALRTGEFRSTEAAAQSMRSEGRLGITDRDRETLRVAAHFETRSEETLFAMSLRELSSDDTPARLRAALRLKALGARAASPAIAAALNAEPDEKVAAALLEVLAAAGDSSVLPLVLPHLKAAAIDVRLAALETAFRLHDQGCLTTALEDPSSLVRRRAAVLATSANGPFAVLERAANDEDASVRRVAVLGIAAASSPNSESALFFALDDADSTVRRSAAKGLSRTRGPEVFAIADLDASRRKREIRHLQSLPPIPRVASASSVSRTSSASPVSLTPALSQKRERELPGASIPVAVSAPVAPPPAAAVAMAPVASGDPGIEGDLLAKVYAALRGQSVEELTRGLTQPAEVVLATASALAKSGKLIRRGQRFFVP